MSLKTKARRTAILNYVELNPGCITTDMIERFNVTLETIQRYLRELKNENQIKIDDSSQRHTYYRLADDNETIARFIEAMNFFTTQSSNTGFNEYLNIMKNILRSRPSLCYYVMLHYNAFADQQEKLTNEKLIDMPYSEKKSQQDIIIENWLESRTLLTEISEKISPEYKEPWIKIISQALPYLNAKPALIIPFTQAAKQFQEGNEQPILDLRDEWHNIEFNRAQEALFSFGSFQYFVNKHRQQGSDVSFFEKVLNENMGFFIYSPKHLYKLIEKMNSYFEDDVSNEDFILELGKDISTAEMSADIVLQTERKIPDNKLQIFRKYKIYCLSNCFMSEGELWDEFLRENEKTLGQLKLKSRETFVRAFNRWNERIDLDEFKQKVQILMMESNESLAYGS